MRSLELDTDEMKLIEKSLIYYQNSIHTYLINVSDVAKKRDELVKLCELLYKLKVVK